MKKLLLSLAAVSALAATAMPAAAQSYRHDGYARENVSRGDMLEMRIQRSLERRQITWQEARSLREQLRDAQRVEWRYTRDGRLSGWERADLDRRFDRVQMSLRHERNDRDYGYGYGYRR